MYFITTYSIPVDIVLVLLFIHIYCYLYGRKIRMCVDKHKANDRPKFDGYSNIAYPLVDIFGYAYFFGFRIYFIGIIVHIQEIVFRNLDLTRIVLLIVGFIISIITIINKKTNNLSVR